MKIEALIYYISKLNKRLPEEQRIQSKSFVREQNILNDYYGYNELNFGYIVKNVMLGTCK